MSKEHIAPQLPSAGVPAPKPDTRTIAFRVTVSERKVLEEFSRARFQGLVTPTKLVSDLFRKALAEGRFS